MASVDQDGKEAVWSDIESRLSYFRRRQAGKVRTGCCSPPRVGRLNNFSRVILANIAACENAADPDAEMDLLGYGPFSDLSGVRICAAIG